MNTLLKLSRGTSKARRNQITACKQYRSSCASSTRKAALLCDENSFEAIAKEYAADRLKDKSQTYVDAFHRAMEKDIYKVIGHKNIKDVTSADVLKIMQNTVKRVKGQDNRGTGEVTAIENRKKIGSVMKICHCDIKS